MVNEYENLDNWKQFQGTELGGLLRSIYGQQKPKVILPKPKAGAKPLPSTFIPGGAGPNATDARKCTRKAVNVQVPKFTGRATLTDSEDHSFMKNHALAAIPRRRSEDVIRTEIEEIKFRQEHYRPGHAKVISSDAEKDRLAQVFTHHGAKTSILPKAFVQPEGEAPFERIERMKEQQLRDNYRIKRGLKPQNNKMITSQLSATEQFAEQITTEINEINEFLQELRMANKGNKPSQQELQIMSEISQRVKELKELDL
jgi:hypothetical protein